MGIACKLLLVAIEALAENSTEDAQALLQTLASRPDYLAEIRSVFADSCEGGAGRLRGLSAVSESLAEEDDLVVDDEDTPDEWDEALPGEPLLGATLSADNSLEADTKSPITLALK